MLLDEFPQSFVPLQIHVSDPYQTEWGDARKEYYGVTATPSCWFDGTLSCVGAYPTVEQQVEWYRSQILARQSVPTEISLEITGEWTAPRTYEALATACRDEGGDPEPMSMRVHLVQALDHWPEAGEDNRYGFKQAAPSKLVYLEPGECRVVKAVFVFDDDSWAAPEKIRLIAWAEEPSDTGPAEVFQAAARDWPFPSCRRGTVDVGAASSPAQVLTLNGSAGVGHVVEIGPGEPVELALATSPSGPVPGPFALYVWLGAPTSTTAVPHPKRLGTVCFPTPLTGGSPQPKKIWNNLGKTDKLGEPDFPSSPAPSVIFSKAGGFDAPFTATFQGFLLDSGSGADVPASVTNAVIVDVR